ncbi:MAG: glyoxalase/bleomycin resistance/dioxygenase family protein, partial [Bdellovibrionaceae bacterium]|nr:glyoxalase/bleomycin resistance/dioxygenase family protein [Bdellovibrio sp.]
AKSPLATGGSVGYWRVSDFDSTVKHFKNHGAELFRGPIQIPTAERICQIKDPFGNVIGIVGPDTD